MVDAPVDFGRRFADAALDRGALLRPIGATLYFMPPYIIDDGEAVHLRDAALDALDAVLGSDAPGARADAFPALP